MRPWVKVAVGLMALLAGAYLGILSTSKSATKPADLPGVLAPERIDVVIPDAPPNVNVNR